MSSAESFIFTLSGAAGVDLVLRLAEAHQLLFGAGVSSFGRWSSLDDVSFETWRASASIGYALTWDDFVTIALGVAAGSRFVQEGSAINPFREYSGLEWIIGSVFGASGRGLPLIRLHVSDVWSIDGYAFVRLSGGRGARSAVGSGDHRGAGSGCERAARA